MQRSYDEHEMGPVTEMAIVHTFTKLIFGDQDYSQRESMIIEALRSIEQDVHRDSYQEMGEYLRSMGVREMIQLVSRLRQHMADPDEAADNNGNKAKRGSAARRPGQQRSPR